MNQSTVAKKPMQILLIEDDNFDELLTKKYLKKALTNYELHVLPDGEKALEFLSHHRPDLILLDMGLPTMDGGEVLDRIKNNPKLKKVPVIVLTAREVEPGAVKKLDLGENCYMNKWINMGDFLTLLKAVEDYSSK